MTRIFLITHVCVCNNSDCVSGFFFPHLEAAVGARRARRFGGGFATARRAETAVALGGVRVAHHEAELAETTLQRGERRGRREVKPGILETWNRSEE